ncbi:MAG: hypothetical protein PUB21_00745 [Bacteroidales bacterium]|nr:hypothetical protein [Bacteroidales bacterium]
MVVCGGIPPSYFLDEMTELEVSAVLDGLERQRREEWERTRRICYTIVQVNSRKPLSPTDIMRFSWDKGQNIAERAMEEADIERLRRMAAEWIEAHGRGDAQNVGEE